MSSRICLTPLLLLALLAVPAPARAATLCEAGSGPQLTPLVELYTAEGCSDCPPADRWLGQLAEQLQPAQAALLAFHVDYWDEAGWPDRFADARYTQRQNARVKIAKGKTVYTPQVMVGQHTQVDWRDRPRFDALLRNARKQPPAVDLQLQLARIDNSLRVALRAARSATPGSDTGKAMVWLALYQDAQTSTVNAGENQGRTLHHDRVVRGLQGPFGLDQQPIVGELSLPLPADADPTQLGVVLFAESIASGKGLQALHVPLRSCE
jgi:hypothetical protein